jgi:hypothetical protein
MVSGPDNMKESRWARVRSKKEIAGANLCLRRGAATGQFSRPPTEPHRRWPTPDWAGPMSRDGEIQGSPGC